MGSITFNRGTLVDAFAIMISRKTLGTGHYHDAEKHLAKEQIRQVPTHRYTL